MKFKINRVFIIIFAFVFLLILVQSCSENSTNPTTPEIPATGVTYSDHIQPLFIAKCASSGCHNFTDKAGGLNLTEYSSVILHKVNTSIGPEDLVKPGDGEGSFLYQILIQRILETPRMPDGEPPLNEQNRLGVKTWIDEGALLSKE